MERIVICEKCSRIIKSRDELVTAMFILWVVPYHDECFARNLKSAKTLFIDNQPLNGFSGNLFAIGGLVLFLIMLIFADGLSKWASLLGLIAIGYRLYSYVVYERLLD